MSLESRPDGPAHSARSARRAQPEASAGSARRAQPEASAGPIGRAGSEDSATPAERARRRLLLLDDPVVIRALAHPLRLDLQALIGRAGQITAADAARELGVSHGLASHHLRQLAKYGFVEQVPGKDNRERPWRLTHTSTSWRDAIATPEGAAAAAVFEQVLAERAVVNLRDWLRRRGDWPDEWQEHTGVGTSTIYLTLPELAELDAAMDAVIRRYVDERPLDDLASRPEGSVPVDITRMIVIPQASPPEGS
jgi:DNA-binding MarR family transcriptional regulator